MLGFIAKAGFAGIMVALIATISKRYPGWGGLLASLPLTSLLAMALLYRDTGDATRVAALSQSIFVYFLPSMPLFLVLPMLLRHWPFWPSLAVVVVATLALYALTFWLAARLGMSL